MSKKRPDWFTPYAFPPWYKRLSAEFRKLLNQQQLLNVNFICSDGSTGAHKMMLGFASQMLKTAIEVTDEPDTIHISVPDFAVDAVKTFLESLYLGAVPTDKAKFDEYVSLIDALHLSFPSSEKDSAMADLEPRQAEEPVSNVLQGVTFENVNETLEAGGLVVATTDTGELVEVYVAGDTASQALVNSVDVAVCAVCQTSLETHRTADDQFQCCVTDCALVCSMSSALLGHSTLHTVVQQDDEMRVCPLCNETRDKHLTMSSDGSNGSRYKCCCCRAARLNAENFFGHVDGHLAHQFVCPKCSNSFPTKQSLYHHKTTAHPENKKNKKPSLLSKAGKEMVTCPTCNKNFTRRYLEQTHKITCGQDALKCDICNQTGFKNKYTLRDHHVAKHTNVRPYKCELCAMTFATATNLYTHRVNRHGVKSNGEAVVKISYPCTLCGKSLTKKSKLNDHIRRVHNGEKNYKCSHCDKRFPTKYNCQVHVAMMHTGDMPHKCDMCDKQFMRKGALQTHKNQEHVTTEQILEDEMHVEVISAETGDDLLVAVEGVEMTDGGVIIDGL